MQEQTGDGMGSQGNVLGGTMIIAGTAIGAGMLALPMISAGMWIYWSLLLMVLTVSYTHLDVYKRQGLNPFLYVQPLEFINA